ncbi:MAG: hypothetical protein ABW098_09195 [Candidatus Thiodiazotropha sp.]
MDEELEQIVIEGDEADAVFAAREAVGHLRRITRDFPHLTTQAVRVALDTWDEEMFRKGELILVEKQRAKAELDAMEQRAIDIIETSQVDDALDIVNREFSKEMDYYGLIDLVGKERYIAALSREAVELKLNSISPEQAAELWNTLGKPTLGGERWNETGVKLLMKGD